MNYLSILQSFPEDLQQPLAQLVDAVEHHMRDQLAVRREDFDELREIVGELAQAQARSEERLNRLEATVERLAEAQERTERAIQRLTSQLESVETRLGDLIAYRLEREYQEKAYAYFGRILRRVQVVSIQELEAELEARLSSEEIDELIPLDILSARPAA